MVRPLVCELRVRESERYRAYYCGLCRSMRKRHGLFSTLFLQYDCSYLGLLLCSAYEDSPCFLKCNCVHLCLTHGKKYTADNASLRFAADMNVLLCRHKFLDDWHDERNLISFVLASLMKPKLKRIDPALCLLVADGLEKLYALERDSCPEPDKVADAFACMLADAVCLAPMVPQHDKTAMHWLFYNLGRWIYLADAYADQKKDAKRGSYNPFLTARLDDEAVEFVLNKSLVEAIKAQELLTFYANSELLDNILRLGCARRTSVILGGQKDEPV